MAQIRLGAESEGTWFTIGEDHGKPVRCKIRPVSREARRRFHREIYGGTKLKKSTDQSVSLAVERMQDYAALRAGYALLETENFSVALGDEAAAGRLSKLLGEKVEVGKEVTLDGKWSDELRQEVLGAAPNHAAFLAKKADDLGEAEIEDEEEEAEGF